ncbi:Proto-oncoprotein vav [Podila epigama]|nr:Proto-oncoprotein vav [Podila epigama]
MSLANTSTISEDRDRDFDLWHSSASFPQTSNIHDDSNKFATRPNVSDIDSGDSTVNGHGGNSSSNNNNSTGNTYITTSLTGADSLAETNVHSDAAGPIDYKSSTATSDLVITIRDFAYPKTQPYHYGHYPPTPEYEESDIEEDDEPMGWYPAGQQEEPSGVFDSYESSTTNGRTCGHARALYDFDAETESELSFRDGDFLWIHCRQYPGWFLGEIAGMTGLVPENYVEML